MSPQFSRIRKVFKDQSAQFVVTILGLSTRYIISPNQPGKTHVWLHDF